MKVPDIQALRDRLHRSGSGLVLVWLGLVLGLVFPYFEATRNANERPRLLQGMALVDEGGWAIDGPAARGLDPGPDVSRSELDGHLYPNKPPGTSLVAAVGYRMARALEADGEPLTLRTYTWWARILGGVLPTLLLCAWLLRRHAPMFGLGATAGAVVLYALGTPAASYAHLLYGHQLAAALLAVGTGLLLDAGARARERSSLLPDPSSSSRERSPLPRAAIGGAVAGAAVAVEYGAAFAALPLAVLLLARLRQPNGIRVLVAGLLGALVPVALLAAYQRAVFGSPWSTGYHHVTNADFAAKHGEGLLGLGLPHWEAFHTQLLSADGGLVWWAPPLVLALYGLLQLALEPGPLRAEARTHLGLLLLYGLLVSSLSFEGGWRVGPRYLVVVLPSLVLGWAHVLSQVRTSLAGMGLLLALGTYAVVVNALAANLWPHLDLTHVHQPVAEVLLPLWEHDREPYGLLRLVTGHSGVGLVVVGSVVGLWVVLLRAAEGGMRMALVIALGGGLGLLLVQATRWFEPHRAGARNLAYIERIWEPTEQGDGRSIALTKELPPAQATDAVRRPPGSSTKKASGARESSSEASRRKPRAP
jgi:hypothetical protein